MGRVSRNIGMYVGLGAIAATQQSTRVTTAPRSPVLNHSSISTSILQIPLSLLSKEENYLFLNPYIVVRLEKNQHIVPLLIAITMMSGMNLLAIYLLYKGI
jgi:hypothetical protein